MISFEDLTKIINKFDKISSKYIILRVMLYPTGVEENLSKESSFVFKKSKKTHLFEKSYLTLSNNRTKKFFDKLFFKTNVAERTVE